MMELLCTNHSLSVRERSGSSEHGLPSGQRTRIMLMLISLAVPGMAGLGAQSHSVLQAESVQQLQASEPRSSQSSTHVSVNVQDSTLAFVVQALAKQAGMNVAYDNTNPVFNRRIRVSINKMSLSEALPEVLKGTGLVSVISSNKKTIVLRPKSDSTQANQGPQAFGAIAGRVTDSATGKSVGSVTVTVAGQRIGATTGDNGQFHLANVPEGEVTIAIKAFGYKPVNRPVTVVAGKSVQLRVVLIPVPTSLSGVVTTATGVKRKIEVGNDITTLNVDSIMQRMPVTSVSDLLANRVPGMDVSLTSGAPGAPSKIRIRGLSSINSTNDPILIVDGVRVYSAQGNTGKAIVTGLDAFFGGGGVNRSTNMAHTNSQLTPLHADQLVPSMIDQIDLNSIATIDVLKGPSAVAQYGTDAANGVIVITTKRGMAGPVRWNTSASFGTETMPGKWPTNYFMWGHSSALADSSGIPIQCRSITPSVATGNSISSGGCIPDSLYQYQILNDPHTTIFGRGSSQVYRLGVGGGNGALTYYVTGTANHKLGSLKIPDADMEILRANEVSVANWQRRPQANSQLSGTARVDVQVKQDLTTTLSSTLTRTETRSTPLASGAAAAEKLPPDGQPLSSTYGPAVGTGVLWHVKDWKKRIDTRSLRVGNTVDISYLPQSWITGRLTGGYDYTARADQSVLDRNDCLDCYMKVGEFNTGQGSALNTNITGLLSNTKVVNSLLNFRTTLGMSFTRGITNDLMRSATDLPSGARSGNGAGSSSTTERIDDRSTAGVYIETVVGIANRFYVPLAIRRDAGSGIGQNVAPKFPNLSFSYVLSDQPGFSAIPILGNLSTLRLRTAYGQSGVQPSIAVKTRTYGQQTNVLDGVSVRTVALRSLGNPDVRPERTHEIEGGVDLGLLNERLSFRLTRYQKYTRDALVNVDLPPSLGGLGGFGYQQNIGQVRNSGWEGEVNARIINMRSVSWDVNANVTRMRNVLTKFTGGKEMMASQASAFSRQRFVEGYPLYGRWARQILGYETVDMYGMPMVTSIVLSDSMVFLGGPLPNFETGIHSDLVLLKYISIGITVNYENGRNQINTGATGNTSLSRGLNDPTLDPAAQANYLGRESNQTDIGFAQTVSILRFDALSLRYSFPQMISRRLVGGRALSMALQGRNLGMKSNYRGKDPSVSGSMSEILYDNGTIPRGRTWELNISVN